MTANFAVHHRFSRERTPMHQHNYRYNNEFDEKNDFIVRLNAMQRDHDDVIVRNNNLQRNNDELLARLDTSQRNVASLTNTSTNLYHDLQSKISQSNDLLVELQHIKQQLQDQMHLQQQNNLLLDEVQTRTSELNDQRQRRRAAEAQLVHQAVKYQDMKKRVAKMDDLRAENDKLKSQIAQLDGAAQVSEMRIAALERQKGGVINVPSSWGRSKEQPQTPQLRLKNTLVLEKATLIRKNDDVGVAPKTPMTTRSSVSQQHSKLLAEALEFIDITNERNKVDREFEDAWKIAKHVVETNKQSTSCSD